MAIVSVLQQGWPLATFYRCSSMGPNLAFDCLMLFGRESEHWQVRIRAQYFFPFKRHNVSVLLRGGQHSCLLDKSRVGVVEWFSWKKNISSKCTILLFLSPLRIWLNHLSGFKLSAFSTALFCTCNSDNKSNKEPYLFTCIQICSWESESATKKTSAPFCLYQKTKD